MKKYRVIQKGTGAIFGEFETRGQAAKKIMEYLNDLNDGGVVILSPFDFEEIECDVNETITDFEIAREALGIKPNDYLTVVREQYSEYAIQLYDASMLVNEINPKLIETLITLNRLYTIAEAWNKEDGFVLDNCDLEQEKWFPYFKYDKDADVLVFEGSYKTDLGSRLCFKTKERAAQFGKQFIELYNKIYLIEK